MLYLLFYTLISLCDASTTDTKSLAQLDKLTAPYQRAATVIIDIEKSVQSELLGKQNNHLGKVYLSGGRFRLETDSPDKTLLIFDGKLLWNVQYPSDDFPGDVQVTKSKIDKRNKQQLLLVNLLKEPLSKNFVVVKSAQNGKTRTYTLKPKAPGLSVKEIIIEATGAEVDGVSYSDDVGNLTQIKFKTVNFSKKTKPELFKYKPEKGAKVSEV